MIQLVFAHNGYEFGAVDGMPWQHIPQDFKNFKARTRHTILIMGAKTFESLPSLLVGRQHFVVCDKTRPLPTAKNGALAHRYMSEFDFECILRMHQTSLNSQDLPFVSVIGGKRLLELALPYASRVVKTSIRTTPIHPDNRIECTQWLNRDFLNDIEYKHKCVESNLFEIDNYTTITEEIFVKHGAYEKTVVSWNNNQEGTPL